MTLMYTIVPPEALWDEELRDPGDAAVNWVQTTYRGVPVLARRTATGLFLERLLTTDPYVYLRSEFAPGTPLDSGE